MSQIALAGAQPDRRQASCAPACAGDFIVSIECAVRCTAGSLVLRVGANCIHRQGERPAEKCSLSCAAAVARSACGAGRFVARRCAHAQARHGPPQVRASISRAHRSTGRARPADGCTHSTALENPRPHRSGPRGCSTDRLRARVAQPAALGALQLRSLVAEHSQWQRSASQSAGSTASLATAAIGPASGVGVISGVTVCRSERVGSGTRVVADTLAVVDGTIPCASMSSCGPSPAAHA